MAILLTGGTGKTSGHIARLLQDANKPFVLASRRAEATASPGTAAVKFDWLDQSTFSNPFKHQFPGGERISAVFVVAPQVEDPTEPLVAFIEYAIKEHGVKRFVLLGAAGLEPGGGHIGKTWQHILDIGVDYAVLLPTWFLDNFPDQQFHAPTIKHEGKIYTATGDGKVPFISASDIAAVAFHTLTDEKPHNTAYEILGPELLTHDEVAAKFSKLLGRTIEHVKLTKEQRIAAFKQYGLPEYLAITLASLEDGISQGSEARLNDVVERVGGRPPQTFDAFVQEHITAWQ